MDFYISLITILVLLIYSVINKIYIFLPLALGLIIFIILGIRRGFSLESIVKMIKSGILKTSKVYILLILISISTALWMASGTVPLFIYYGLKMIKGEFFLISAFLASYFVSLILGTSFGTVGTIGVVFMIMARAAGMNLNLVAGAIITAAYIGERSTPLSSSTTLISILTKTDVYSNIKKMFSSTIIPFILTLLLYTYLSFKNPGNTKYINDFSEISHIYNLDIFLILPALSIIVFVILKVKVEKAIIISIIIAFLESIFFQGTSLLKIFNFILFGYSLEGSSTISTIIHGGGFFPMLKTILVVMVSSSYAGILEGTGLLLTPQNIIGKISDKFGVFFGTTLTSIIGASFGCTQAFSIVMTSQVMDKIYKEKKISSSKLAVDIGNSALIISPLIPWNIAGAFPASVLGVSPVFIPYSFFLYLVPIYIFILERVLSKKR